jgi:hypothetical protein
MGFMDWMLEKSEQRLFENVIEGLESIDGKIKYTIESLVCAENPDFTHLALRARVPNKKLYFHRCRNDWYFSEGTKGRDYLLLNGVDKFNPGLAIAQLHILIESVSSPAKDELEPERNVKKESVPSRRNKSQTKAPEIDAWKESLFSSALASNLMVTLSAILVEPGTTQMEAEELLRPYIEEFQVAHSRNIGDEPEEEGLGSKWLADEAPETKFGATCLRLIDSRYKSLVRIGATAADIVDFWNLSFSERTGLYLTTVVSRIKAERKVSGLYSEVEADENLHSQETMLRAMAITADPIGKKVSFDETDPLPLEVLVRAMSLLQDFRDRHENELANAVTIALSVNSVARYLLRGLDPADPK